MDSDSSESSDSSDLSLSPTVREAKKAVNEICSHIREEFKEFNIHNIVKGGSLGSGTVVPGHYDIDLVVYSKSFTGQEVIPPDLYKPWLLKLKQFIERLPGVEIKESGENSAKYVIKFSYKIQSVSIDVDLLVSPHWDKPSQFYEFLKETKRKNKRKKKKREKIDLLDYSVCVSRWQQSFLRKRAQVVKEYVRTAKAWRNEVWKDDMEGKPKSYLMQLLVIKAHQCACIRRHDSQREGAAKVTEALKKLVKKDKLNVYWADRPSHFYRRRDYVTLLPKRPRVIDPANPSNNLWETGFHSGGPSQLIDNIDTIDLSKHVE